MNADRIGDWFVLANGQRFWPLDPRPEEICIKSTAHALANINRFGGHSATYSVGQHSCIVSDHCPDGLKLEGLLHDAPEALGLGDIVRPLKQNLPDVIAAERKIWNVIATKYKLTNPIHKVVKVVDLMALLAERDQLMPKSENTAGWWMDKCYMPLPVKIVPWHPSRTRVEFMERFNKLWNPETISASCLPCY